MYPVDHLIRHWQTCGMHTVDYTACVQTQEVKTALNITRWAKGQCTYGTCVHGIIMLFMRLDIITKIILTMSIIGDGSSSHYCPRTQCS